MTMGTRDYMANRAEVPTGTLTGLFFQAADRFGDKAAYQSIRDGGLVDISYREAYSLAMAVAGGLHALGIAPGERVALLSENRAEWSQSDWGALLAAVPDVPIYSTLTAPQVGYILKDSGARVVFASTDEQLVKALAAKQLCQQEIQVVVFDPVPDLPEGVLAWDAFLRMGEEALKEVGEDHFRARAEAVQPEDVATILYTSGTTGEPKGVVLTHNNLYTNLRACLAVIPVYPTDVTLSFLPLSHVFQRTADYFFFSEGCTVAYARSLKTIAEDLTLVRPTKVVSVPRVYEKIFKKIVDQTGVKGRLVRWAREVGDAWADEKLAGREPTVTLRAIYGLAHRLVFSKIHRSVGGRLEFFISGGAPLAAEINKFFYSAGILILEGYGLTETSPVLTANTPSDFQVGTVGPPVPSTEVRIAEDGEILVRGPQVMKGYFNRPEDTAAVLSPDGWFSTGDIGEIDDRGHLRITDRKKDVLVTAGGKNIPPQPIERLLSKSPFVEQAVLLGEGRNFTALLVAPAFERLEAWARSVGIAFADRTELLRNRRVQERMSHEIFKWFEDLAVFEKPKKIGLILEEFTIEAGILTPSQKVKRRAVYDRYGALIERLYDPANMERSVFSEVD
jgi:long-chain acyl-CoA synthetase